MKSLFPACKQCGAELLNGLDMGKELCGQCWFDSFEPWDDSCAEPDKTFVYDFRSFIKGSLILLGEREGR